MECSGRSDKYGASHDITFKREGHRQVRRWPVIRVYEAGLMKECYVVDGI